MSFLATYNVDWQLLHLICSTCLLTQILLYGKKLDNKDQFFREVRAEELTRVLNNYFKTGLYEECLSLIKLLKSDLLVLE